MRISPLFMTKLLPAIAVRLGKTPVEDVVIDHEVRLQDVERRQGILPGPEKEAAQLIDQRRLELLEDEVKRLQNEILLLRIEMDAKSKNS